MRLLVIAIGSIGQGIAERFSSLVMGFLEEQVSYSFVNVDHWKAPRLARATHNDVHTTSVVIPMRPLLGESFRNDSWGGDDSSETIGAKTTGCLSGYSPLRLEAMLDVSDEQVEFAFEAATERGGLQGIDCALDSALYVEDTPNRELHVVFVGAACDPLVVVGVPQIAEHICEYLQERYNRANVRSLALLLATDCVADSLARKADRDRLRSQEAKLLGEISSCEQLDECFLIPVLNADGRRLSCSEDYCLMVAGLLAAEVAGLWNRSLFDGGASVARGFSVVEFPHDVVARWITLGVVRDAVGWWTAMDDLWLAGGWSDFGFGTTRQGEFYQTELHRLAMQDKHVHLHECVEQLDNLMAEYGSPEAADQLTEQMLAEAAVEAMDEQVREGVHSWLSGHGADGTIPLGSKLQRLPQNSGELKDMLARVRVISQIRRLWLTTLDALENRLQSLDELDEHMKAVCESGLDAHNGCFANLGLPQAVENVHPVTMRCVLYALYSEVTREGEHACVTARKLEVQLDRVIHTTIDFGFSDGQAHTLREAIVLATEEWNNLGSEGAEPDERDATTVYNRLASMGHLINRGSALVEELATSRAKTVFLHEMGERVGVLLRQYELLFDGVRYFEHELDREMDRLYEGMVYRRGSCYLPVGTDIRTLEVLLAHCKDHLDKYPVGYASWKNVHCELWESAGGLPQARLEALRRDAVDAVDAKKALLRTILLGGPNGSNELAKRICAMLDFDIVRLLDVGESTVLDGVWCAEELGQKGLREALALAAPFGAASAPDTTNSLITALPVSFDKLQEEMAWNESRVLTGMNTHRLIVLREAILPKDGMDVEKRDAQ